MFVEHKAHCHGRYLVKANKKLHNCTVKLDFTPKIELANITTNPCVSNIVSVNCSDPFASVFLQLSAVCKKISLTFC